MAKGKEALMLCDGPVFEVDGPPTAWFEIPLEYWATPNGELEPPSNPEASRLVARIEYKNFRVPTMECADDLVDSVRAGLRLIGGGILWWRRHPVDAMDAQPIGVRLATSPDLPADYWEGLRRTSHSIPEGTPHG